MTYANLVTPGPINERLGAASGGPGFINAAALTTIPIVGATPGVAGTGGTGWGNLGATPMLGPGQFNFDVIVAKTTRVGGIHENGALQFRAEFFNIFNHSQFGNPALGGGVSTPVGNNFAQGNFGQITAMSVNPRLMQFALKYVF